MKKILLALILIAQVSVPAFMVYRYESTLTSGVEYRFEVRPYDPYDPFRGRYVDLVFAERTVLYNGEQDMSYGDFAYATLKVGDDGLAKLVELFTEAPASGDYLKVKYRSWSSDDSAERSVSFIFDRYYANEKKAPNIESAVRQLTREIDESEKVTALVKVKDGLGVIEELYVGDMTIHQYLSSEK